MASTDWMRASGVPASADRASMPLPMAAGVLGMIRTRAGGSSAPASHPRMVSRVRPAAMDTTVWPAPRTGASSSATPRSIWGLTQRNTTSAWAAAERLSSATAQPRCSARASAFSLVRLVITTCSAPRALHAAPTRGAPMLPVPINAAFFMFLRLSAYAAINFSLSARFNFLMAASRRRAAPLSGHSSR